MKARRCVICILKKSYYHAVISVFRRERDASIIAWILQASASHFQAVNRRKESAECVLDGKAAVDMVHLVVDHEIMRLDGQRQRQSGASGVECGYSRAVHAAIPCVCQREVNGA